MPSDRLARLDVSPIRKLFEAAGPDVVHLGLGQPQLEPPLAIREALAKAAMEGPHGYGPTPGLPALRQAVADFYADAWDGITAENVLVTPGSTMALYATGLALLNRGDETLVPDPGFVLYDPHAKLVDAKPVPYGLDIGNGFAPDLDELENLITPKTESLIVNSPGNPTGAVLSEKDIDGLVDLAERHDLWLISDEAYDRLVYDGEHITLAGRYEKAIVVNTMSKTLAIPGWRLGVILAPDAAAQPLRRALYHLGPCPSTPIQQGVLPYFDAPEAHIRPIYEELKHRRDALVKGFGALDDWFDLHVPQGALYAFPRLKHDTDSMAICQALLEEAKVVTSPGMAFGPGGEGHVRFSFGGTVEEIQEGLDRVRGWFQARDDAGT